MSFFELIVESDRYRIRSMATARPITRQRSTGSIHSQPPSRNFCIITWCMLSPAICGFGSDNRLFGCGSGILCERTNGTQYGQGQPTESKKVFS